MDTGNARNLRKNMTDAERRLWQKLKRRQLGAVKFRRQQPIGRFIVDFVCFECGVIVEIDGGQHTQQIVYDEERTRWLNTQGFRILRFWNNDVLVNTDAVVQTVFDAIATHGRPPTLALPHKGGGNT